MIAAYGIVFWAPSPRTSPVWTPSRSAAFADKVIVAGPDSCFSTLIASSLGAAAAGWLQPLMTTPATMRPTTNDDPMRFIAGLLRRRRLEGRSLGQQRLRIGLRAGPGAEIQIGQNEQGHERR